MNLLAPPGVPDPATGQEGMGCPDWSGLGHSEVLCAHPAGAGRRRHGGPRQILCIRQASGHPAGKLPGTQALNGTEEAPARRWLLFVGVLRSRACWALLSLSRGPHSLLHLPERLQPQRPSLVVRLVWLACTRLPFPSARTHPSSSVWFCTATVRSPLTAPARLPGGSPQDSRGLRVGVQVLLAQPRKAALKGSRLRHLVFREGGSGCASACGTLMLQLPGAPGLLSAPLSLSPPFPATFWVGAQPGAPLSVFPCS